MNGPVGTTMHPEIRVRVDRFVDALNSSPIAKHVVAVIVAGSACRGEEIWRDRELVSDIDLMVVTRRTNPWLTNALSDIMRPFRTYGIDGGPTPLPTLSRYRTFSFFEARAAGVIVWGDKNLGCLLPPVDAAELPRWEAIRVLANRMFEHLKVTYGQATLEQATTKTYEALTEAALAVEGRYRPSYRQRLHELINDPPALLSPSCRSRAIGVLRARLDSETHVHPALTDAHLDLMSGLSDVLRMYLDADGTLTQLLELLGRRERHWRHRLYWALSRRGSGLWTSLSVDPVIGIWQEAARALAGFTSSTQAEELAEAWKVCPQILRYTDPGVGRLRLRTLQRRSVKQ